MKKINNVANCLYLARVTTRLKQSDLAKMAKCSTSMISAIEAGNKIPSVKLVIKIAKALGVSQDTIYMYASEDLKKEIELFWASE